MLPLARLEGEQKSSAIYAYLFISATLTFIESSSKKGQRLTRRSRI
jgi:hypothetical protein